MAGVEKQTEEITLRMSPELKRELLLLADRDDRTLREYIRLVLTRHVHGHRTVDVEPGQD